MALNARLILRPLLSAAIGALGAVLLFTLPRTTGATLAVVFYVVATLARGERGLMEWLPKLRMLGSLLALCLILTRWYALAAMKGDRTQVILILAAVHALSEAASIVLAWISRPVDDRAVRVLSKLDRNPMALAAALGALPIFWVSPRLGVILIIAAYFCARALQILTEWRYRGLRGSDLDAAPVVALTLCLVLAAGLPDLW